MSTVWGWFLTLEERDEPTRYYAPNRHNWQKGFGVCQPSTKEAAEGFAVLFAAKKPKWIGKLRLRRMKLIYPWSEQPLYTGSMKEEPGDAG